MKNTWPYLMTFVVLTIGVYFITSRTILESYSIFAGLFAGIFGTLLPYKEKLFHDKKVIKNEN